MLEIYAGIAGIIGIFAMAVFVFAVAFLVAGEPDDGQALARAGVITAGCGIIWPAVAVIGFVVTIIAALMPRDKFMKIYNAVEAKVGWR